MQLLGDAELMNAREVIETLAVDYLWTDGTPQYTADGYLRTPPKAREHGFGESDFRWLGRWFPYQFLYPQPDGSEAVFDENGRTYMMFPPGHPELKGRRGVPLGSLEHAWRRPGFFPHQRDMLISVGERFERGDQTLGSVVMPWDR